MVTGGVVSKSVTVGASILIGFPVDGERDGSVPNTSGDAPVEPRSMPNRKSAAGDSVGIGFPELSRM